MKIKSLLVDEFSFYGIATNEKQIDLWARELADLNPHEVAAALDVLRKDPKRQRPALPAQIRDVVFSYPTTEEAWAMCPKNEQDSVVWCDEIAEAYGQVRGLLASGDAIAARMAFKEIYDREVGASKALKRKPRFFASFGFDPAGRDEALKYAVEKNRISAETALSYNPALQIAASARTTNLLPAPQKSDDMNAEQKEKNRAKIRELLKMLKGGKSETAI